MRAHMVERHISDQSVGEAGLADPTDARSNCGVGVVMDLDGGSDHETVADGLELLENLEHRGTTGAEKGTGDGAGIMLQIPHDFFAEEIDADLPDPGAYAVGTLFLPKDDDEAAADLKALVETELAGEGLDIVGWRTVPTDNDGLGATALDSEPEVAQFVVTADDGASGEELDNRLYVGRRALENTVEEEQPPGHDRFYVVSLATDVVVYKGLLKAEQLPGYYPDLSDERFESTFAMVHARFSTNTLGAWHLAHPYRRVIHNGEFNTIQGNINWMRARETDIASDSFEGDIERIKPIIDDPTQSDTASVDNALELLLQGGRDLPHALRMLIPEAWRGEMNNVSGDRKEFYDYHASLVEPWDGPALVAATDGERIGAVLDRNGLRPCRYDVLEDNTLVMSSEAGALEADPSEIAERGRLQPGQCFLADPEEGRVIPDAEVFDGITDEKYGEWVAEEQVDIEDIAPREDNTPQDPVGGLRSQQAMYGYTYDEVDHLIEPMAEKGKDPVGSMGDDTPLSVLSQFNRPLFTYFKQLFAQVTNPPLDYIREELVTSLESRLGYQRNLLSESQSHARQLVLDSPILTDEETAAIKEMDDNGMSTKVVDITYDPGTELRQAVEDVRSEASAAAEEYDIIVLSDRGAGEDRVPIPSLLAVGGIHHHLVRNGLRNHVGLVLESGDPRAVHHFATLIGYGAGVFDGFAQVTALLVGDVDDLRRHAVLVDTLDGVQFLVGEDGRVEHELSGVGLTLVEQVALVAQSGLQRGDQFLTDVVQRRVRDLGEQLLEVGKERSVELREHRQRRVVAHRPDGVFPLLGHGLDEVVDLVVGVAVHRLVASQAVDGVLWGVVLPVRDVGDVDLFLGDPLAVLLVGNVLEHFGVRNDAALLGVGQETLTGLEAAAFGDLAGVVVQRAGLGGHHERVVFEDVVATRAQAVAVQHGADAFAVRRRDERGAVPRFDERSVVVVEVLAVARDLVHLTAPRLGDEHPERVREVTTALQEEFERVVDARGV